LKPSNNPLPRRERKVDHWRENRQEVGGGDFDSIKGIPLGAFESHLTFTRILGPVATTLRKDRLRMTIATTRAFLRLRRVRECTA
jgi:hypothetical protein